MIKVGIVGSHGVGKTTLANKLVKKYQKKYPEKRVNLLPEVARECPFPISLNSSIEAQRWIYHQQMVKEIEMEAISDILICDRTILDNLAYSHYWVLHDILDNCFEPALNWMHTYDTVYFLRPTFPLVADDVRPDNVEFQKAIDAILDKWIEEYGIKTEVYQFKNRGDKSKWNKKN